MHRKGVGGGYRISRSWILDELTDIDGMDNDLDFELTFRRDETFGYSGMSSLECNQLVWFILRLLAMFGKEAPRLVRIDQAALNSAAKETVCSLQHLEEMLESKLGGASHADRLIAAEALKDVDQESSAVTGLVISETEAQILEDLLTTSGRGIDEGAAFSEWLDHDVAELETGNVHALLESESLSDELHLMADNVCEELDRTRTWLARYRSEVEAIHRDIQGIESRNALVEVQMRNHQALLAELTRLLDQARSLQLRLPRGAEKAISRAALEDAEEAEGVGLYVSKLQEVLNRPMDSEYSDIAAVTERRKSLVALRGELNERLCVYLSEALPELAWRLWTSLRCRGGWHRTRRGTSCLGNTACLRSSWSRLIPSAAGALWRRM